MSHTCATGSSDWSTGSNLLRPPRNLSDLCVKAFLNRSTVMQVGAAMFFTDYSMEAADLAQALEARGFESVWAPEHSHIPTSRRSPYQAGGELPKQYYDVMDPFVTLSV